MKIIVWLGNVGNIYKHTRHNIWFEIIDYFAQNNNFPNFIENKKFNWQISEWKIQNQKIILVKPSTFMNLSWECIKPLIQYFKINTQNLLVIHDDIDLEIWKIKYKIWWSSAWHNWLKSIINSLWTNYFARIRIWIWRPTNPKFKIADYVLSKFTKEELNKIFENYDKIEQYIYDFLTQ